MERTHRYRYGADDEIPHFYWHEEGVSTAYSIPIGGSLVMDIGHDGRIVGFEIYDLDIGIDDETLKEEMKEEKRITLGDNFDAPAHGEIVLTEHWRHETVLVLLEAIRHIEFSQRDKANDAISLARLYLNDDDWSWLCLRCENPLITCECKEDEEDEEDSPKHISENTS